MRERSTPPWLDPDSPLPDPFPPCGKEVHLFCPLRLFVRDQPFEALLDSIHAAGGGFFVLREPGKGGGLLRPGRKVRLLRADPLRAEPEEALRGIILRVQGDDSGLLDYVRVGFSLRKGGGPRNWADLFDSLW